MSQTATIRWLTLANVTLMLLVGGLLLSGFARTASPVLTAERINIVDSTGSLALVLANGRRLPGAMFHGDEYPQEYVGRGHSAGMIFFNQAGDEVGGLIYEGARHDSSYRAFGHMSFDQWQQNQVVAVQYQDDGRSRSAGVRVRERPTTMPLEVQFALARSVQTTPKGPVRDSLDRERVRARDLVTTVGVHCVHSAHDGPDNDAVSLRDRHTDTRPRKRPRFPSVQGRTISRAARTAPARFSRTK